MKASKDKTTYRPVAEADGDEVARTVKLATHSFGALDLSDDQIDDLCAVALAKSPPSCVDGKAFARNAKQPRVEKLRLDGLLVYQAYCDKAVFDIANCGRSPMGKLAKMPRKPRPAPKPRVQKTR